MASWVNTRRSKARKDLLIRQQEEQLAAINARHEAIHALMGPCEGLSEQERRARYWAAADIVDGRSEED